MASRDHELWEFIASHLNCGGCVMLLVVSASTGSSPGHQGYKMAVAPDSTLCGSIGGGVMEVRLVELAKAILSEPEELAIGFPVATLIEQVHQQNSTNASGMICSGKQTIIQRLLNVEHAGTVDAIIQCLQNKKAVSLTITTDNFSAQPTEVGTQNGELYFEKLGETDFLFRENLGPQNHLLIIGGGHCTLALSELMSKMDFRISIFDDRPDLNTIEKNRFAHEITIIGDYDEIGGHIPNGNNIYVVVMTLGYKSDQVVVSSLLDKDLRYFGVLGSKAKMKTLLKELENDGFSKERLSRIHTPIGLPINSHTPEEIAVSIAAEIISIKNSSR